MRESPLMKIWISFRFKNFWVSMRRSQSARANQEVGKGIAICPSLITTMTSQLQIAPVLDLASAARSPRRLQAT